jgi:hypothetical protein
MDDEAPEPGSRAAEKRARWLWLRFVASLLLGLRPRPSFKNPNVAKTPTGFSAEDYQRVVEEGRRQLDGQADTFRHTIARAQLLVTVSLAGVAFWVGVFALVTSATGSDRLLSGVLWVIGGTTLVFGVAATGGVVVAPGFFSQVDTTQLAEKATVEHLAGEYIRAVRLGEVTVADRLTAFRQATRLVVWGALLTAAAATVAL